MAKVRLLDTTMYLVIDCFSSFILLVTRKGFTMILTFPEFLHLQCLIKLHERKCTLFIFGEYIIHFFLLLD